MDRLGHSLSTWVSRRSARGISRRAGGASYQQRRGGAPGLPGLPQEEKKQNRAGGAAFINCLLGEAGGASSGPEVLRFVSTMSSSHIADRR